MSRTDAASIAERLYTRIPGHYRTYDAQNGFPLRALVQVMGEQATALRQDLDALWDNFFIETADDWVVPYLAGLVGTNLLARPVGQSNRLDVWNTIRWRRSKGTPAMLRALASAISGWPTDLAEFFQALGWAQNLNHLRLDHPLTPDLRDPFPLSLLGRAADPLAHAVDVRPPRDLDQSRITTGSVGVGTLPWGTPDRYTIKQLGFFVRRLRTFRLEGATPAASDPGVPPPAGAACFTFDPLHRQAPLFVQASAEPLTREAFDREPWRTFGSDVAVRQFGVLLADDAEPTPDTSSQQTAFDFGGAGAGLGLHASNGLRLLAPRTFQLGGAHFVITAGWQEKGGGITTLGALSTLHAAMGDGDAFHLGATTGGPGRLVVTVEPGRAGLGWPGLPSSPMARFPGAVLAVCSDRTPTGEDQARYVYLPAVALAPGTPVTWHVAVDGSTYAGATMDPATLARASEGQVYPPRPLTASARPATELVLANRKAGGLIVADPGRFGGSEALVETLVYPAAAAPQVLGAVCTVDQPQAAHPGLDFAALGTPDPWPAFTFVPSRGATGNTVPEEGMLGVRVRALGTVDVPPSELVVANRFGQSLLVYLPAVGPGAEVVLFVADDGATYEVPSDPVLAGPLVEHQTLAGLDPARRSAGQVLPIPGRWPLQHRSPVAMNLCRCERTSLLADGELGIDPELGRFGLADGDPAIETGRFTVDYVEAFAGRVGARTFPGRLDPAVPPTRLVSRSGDARVLAAPTIPDDHVHSTVDDAVASAADGDVIEIVDSATYASTTPIVLAQAALRRLTIRAADRTRPCLTFYQADGTPLDSSVRVAVDMDSLELSGLLVSGAPLLVEGEVHALDILACTLDPLPAASSLAASDADADHRTSLTLCRSIAGTLLADAGVTRLTVADSVLDGRGGLAVGAPPLPAALGEERPAPTVQLERTTVLGRIRCDVLSASECLFDNVALVGDRQSGCVRFTRYEPGSVLPPRYQCVPTDAQHKACPPTARCVAPLFNSRQFGRPDYAQLAAGCPAPILSASEEGAEVGAFASDLNPIRVANLTTKLAEFLPVALTATVIAET